MPKPLDKTRGDFVTADEWNGVKNAAYRPIVGPGIVTDGNGTYLKGSLKGRRNQVAVVENDQPGELRVRRIRKSNDPDAEVNEKTVWDGAEFDAIPDIGTSSSDFTIASTDNAPNGVPQSGPYYFARREHGVWKVELGSSTSSLRIVGYYGAGVAREITYKRTEDDPKEPTPEFTPEIIEGEWEWVGDPFPVVANPGRWIEDFDWFILDPKDTEPHPYAPLLRTELVNGLWILQEPRIRILDVLEFQFMSTEVKNLMIFEDVRKNRVTVCLPDNLRADIDSHGETSFDNELFSSQRRKTIVPKDQSAEQHIITPQFVLGDILDCYGPVNTGIVEDIFNRNVVFKAMPTRVWGEETQVPE